MSMNELEAKVAELRELRRMADELAAEITATEDALKAYMTGLFGGVQSSFYEKSSYALSDFHGNFKKDAECL